MGKSESIVCKAGKDDGNGGCVDVDRTGKQVQEEVINRKVRTKTDGQAVFWGFLHTMWKGTKSVFADGGRRRSWSVLIVN